MQQTLGHFIVSNVGVGSSTGVVQIDKLDRRLEIHAEIEQNEGYGEIL